MRKNTIAAAALFLAAGAGILAGCNGGAANEGAKIAGVAGAASAALLSPADIAKLQQLCAANTAITALAANPALPATVTQTAVYPADYCAKLAAGTMPPTTDSNTPSWLPGVLSAAKVTAQIAGVVVPLIL